MWPYFCMPFLLACTNLPSELKRKLMMGLRLSMARMRALSALAASAISHSTATSTGAFTVRLNWICCRHDGPDLGQYSKLMLAALCDTCPGHDNALQQGFGICLLSTSCRSVAKVSCAWGP